MQKQKKQLIIMIIVLAALIVCYFALKAYNSRQEEKEAEETQAALITVTDVEQDDITAISFSWEGGALDLAKNDDDEWYVTSDESINLDQDKVKTLLAKVNAITADEKIEEYDSLSEYGLETPAVTVSFTAGDEEKTLSFGMTNDVLSKDYMIKEGDDNLYLVTTSISSAFQITVDDLIEVEESTEEVEEGTEEATESTEITESTEAAE